MTTLHRAMTEDELLTAITEAATLYGWMWHHVRRSDKALQMGNAGFPDLVLARNGTVLFLELKSEKGNETPNQTAWLNALDRRTEDGPDALVIRPRDLDAVLRMLR